MLYAFVALLDKHGCAIPDAKLKPRSVSMRYSAEDGEAEIYAGDFLIGRLTNARIAWIEAGGIRIQGTEHEMTKRGWTTRYQEWHFSDPHADL